MYLKIPSLTMIGTCHCTDVGTHTTYSMKVNLRSALDNDVSVHQTLQVLASLQWGEPRIIQESAHGGGERHMGNVCTFLSILLKTFVPKHLYLKTFILLKEFLYQKKKKNNNWPEYS